MRRRVLLVGGGALAFAARAQGQAPALVAVLSPVTPVQFAANGEAFLRGMREARLFEGRDFRLEPRFAGGALERLAGLAAELVALRPRVMLTASSAGILAARGATSEIPIVFATTGLDLVAHGVVASIARPGGNITGFTSGEDLGLHGKRLGLLREAVPGLARVAAVVNPRDPFDDTLAARLPAAAQAAGLSIEIVAARDAGEIAAAFATAAAAAEALFVSSSPLFTNNRSEVIALAARLRRPAIYGWDQFAAAGGLMAYGPSFPEIYRAAAGYVARILRGELPANLPVQEPTVFRLSINLPAARALGLTLPYSLLAAADEVIE